MLQSLRERLVLVLIILLPFHAFVVTVLTRMIAGQNHSPIGALALWKEIFLGIILLIAFIEILIVLRSQKLTANSYKPFNFDVLDWIIVLSILIGTIASIFNFPFSIFHFAYGVKYDFLPLIAFLILRRVPWSAQFLTQVLRSILIVGMIVAGYGMLTFFLPAAFFSWLGYSPIHSLYFSDGPIAAFQFIGNTGLRRIQSVMSGPNQMGLWLLIPLSVALVQAASRRANSYKSPEANLAKSGLTATSLLILLVALFMTFSRSAWIGAFVMTMVAIGMTIPARMRRKIIGSTVAFAFVVSIVLIVAFPAIFGRLGSTRGHWERPMEAINIMIAHPFGLGLGTAGPASNRGTDTCVHLRPQDDPAWAKPITNLCVFLGKVQVQPTDRACNCPLLTENWYLQWGVEMGWIGFVLSLALVALVLRSLKVSGFWFQGSQIRSLIQLPATSYQLPASPIQLLSSSIFLVFLGISLSALFLHAWEDAAVAYTVWIMIAITFSFMYSVRRNH